MHDGLDASTGARTVRSAVITILSISRLPTAHMTYVRTAVQHEFKQRPKLSYLTCTRSTKRVRRHIQVLDTIKHFHCIFKSDLRSSLCEIKL